MTRCALRGQGTSRSQRDDAARHATARRAGAFEVRIGIPRHEAARSIDSAPFFRRRARDAGSAARIVTTNAIDAGIRQTLGVRRTRYAEAQFASIGPVAHPIGAFIVGIGIDRNAAARAIRSAPFFRCRTRFAGPRTRRIATDAVRAESGCAFAVIGARNAETRRRAHTRSAARTSTAIAVGIRAGCRIATLAVDSAAFFRCGTRPTNARTSFVAAETIRAEAI